MLQVLSNTEIVTDWFLTAIKSCPLAACPMNSAALALLQNVSLSRYTAHKCLYSTRKKNQPISQFPPFWKNCTRRWDQGKGLLFWAVFQSRIEIATQTDHILFIFKQSYVSIHIAICPVSKNGGKSFIRIYKKASEKQCILEVSEVSLWHSSLPRQWLILISIGTTLQELV